MASKEIKIVRKEEHGKMIPPEVAQGARIKLSSVFVGAQPLRPLSREEEEKYLPSLVGYNPKDDKFIDAVKKYWMDFTKNIPTDGLTLEIGTDEEGEPLNVQDYVIFQFAKKHPQVADNKALMDQHPRYKFFIYDYEKLTREKYEENQLKKKSMKDYAKVSDDKEKTLMVLRVLSDIPNPDELSVEQKDNELHNLAEQTPEKFSQVANDKDLQVRYNILKMVDHNVLQREGNSYIFLEEVIGETMDDTVKFFNRKSNSKKVTAMKEKLKAATR